MALTFFENGLTQGHLGNLKGTYGPTGVFLDFPHRNGRLYFHTEADRDHFLQFNCITGYSRRAGMMVTDYLHADLGLLLGYPPDAVEAFTSGVSDTGVNFGDMSFACEFSQIPAIVGYLWKRYGRKVPFLELVVTYRPKGVPHQRWRIPFNPQGVTRVRSSQDWMVDYATKQ